MPTYEFECQECQAKFEHEMNVNDLPNLNLLCPNPDCSGTQFKRLISGGSGFVLSGGGWAKDGYSKR